MIVNRVGLSRERWTGVNVRTFYDVFFSVFFKSCLGNHKWLFIFSRKSQSRYLFRLRSDVLRFLLHKFKILKLSLFSTFTLEIKYMFIYSWQTDAYLHYDCQGFLYFDRDANSFWKLFLWSWMSKTFKHVRISS